MTIREETRRAIEENRAKFGRRAFRENEVIKTTLNTLIKYGFVEELPETKEELTLEDACDILNTLTGEDNYGDTSEYRIENGKLYRINKRFGYYRFKE